MVPIGSRHAALVKLAPLAFPDLVLEVPAIVG